MQSWAGSERAPARAATLRSLAYVAGGAWAVFGVISLFVAVDPTSGVDYRFQRLVADAGHDLLAQAPWLGRASLWVAGLGSLHVAIAVILIASAALAIWRRTLAPGVLLGLSFVSTALTVGVLKDLFLRPEPYDVAGDLSFSFPSGHAAVAVAAWGGTAFVILVFMGRRPGKAETILALAGAVVALGVGGAMIARSAHWLTDVVAGVALGIAWLATVAAALVGIGWLPGGWWRSAEADRPVGAAKAVRVDEQGSNGSGSRMS